MTRATKPKDSPNPTEVTNEFWVGAFSEVGTYPESNEHAGKWLVFVEPLRVDEMWATVKAAVEGGRLGKSAKCSTARLNPNAASDTHVICVYTYDWTDEADVKRIRGALRELGITWKIPYKADEDTMAGKYVVRGNKRISKYYE